MEEKYSRRLLNAEMETREQKKIQEKDDGNDNDNDA
jgi:hypothetical protein